MENKKGIIQKYRADEKSDIFINHGNERKIDLR